MKRGLYPPNWEEISRRIRYERAQGQCECLGECGLHHDHRCDERDGEPAKWARGKVMLTVAHLNHDPSCDDETQLRAFCNRCHLRYDTTHHMRNAARTRHNRRAVGPIPGLEEEASA